MRKYFISVILISFLACGKDEPYQYVNPRSNGSVTLKSRSGVVKLAVIIKAKANCPSSIVFYINKNKSQVSLVDSIDTVWKTDWYGEEVTFKAQIDSCIVGDPVIGVKFL